MNARATFVLTAALLLGACTPAPAVSPGPLPADTVQRETRSPQAPHPVPLPANQQTVSASLPPSASNMRLTRSDRTTTFSGHALPPREVWERSLMETDNAGQSIPRA